MNKYLIVSFLFLILLSVSFVSADENITLDEELPSHDIGDVPVSEPIENTSQSTDLKEATKIQAIDVKTYYKQDSQLVSYLKDTNNNPIANKKISISINNKNYNKITDNAGKVTLKLNLRPGTYTAVITFAGDDNYTQSSANAIVNVKKSALSIKTDDYSTYFESEFYFKAKVINKVTKNPVKGVKVAFKVYKNNKYKVYYATTDAKGIAKLKRNLNVGSYKVVTSIKKNKYIKAKKTKASLTIKETAEMGCSSLFVQVSGTEAVTGFRRDTTNSRALHIVKYKLEGKAAVKQYKSSSYFFHSIITADGWMMGTGGADNPTINKAIEKLAGKMAKSGKIIKIYLKKIQKYERSLGIGHFSIKSPNGKYAVVWSSAIKTGKLKAGQYLCAPNGKKYFKIGNWKKLSKNPAKAAIKIAASDKFGINRRDATAFHWKATTTGGKTTSTLKVYAANDNGRLAGRSTAYLKDDIYFKGTFFSKNKLPKTPSSMLLGVHKFGNIDKLIKTQTTVKAPELCKNSNESATLNITVKDKKTKSPVKNLKLKVKINNKTYTVKTDSKGVARFNPKSLDAGKYAVTVYTDNIKYKVSAKSTIIIT